MEVFYRPRLTDADIAMLRANGSRLANLAGDLLASIVAPYAGEPRVSRGDCRSCIGDAGLVCLMVAPELAVIRRHPVHVSLRDPLTRGMTVVSISAESMAARYRRCRRRGPSRCWKLALEIDGDAIVKMFLDALLK